MSTSYAAWAKFDVEKELERVDEAAQREQQEQQIQRQQQAKESVESSAVRAAQQSADVLAAQAAVAALKAKRGRRKTSSKAEEEETEDGETQRAETLQAQASLFAKKQELLQRIMESRRLGDAAVKEKLWDEAKRLFEVALDGVKQLEELAPQLLEAEQQQAALLKKREESAVTNQEETHEHKSCTNESEEHQCGGSCSHDGKKMKKRVEALPKANDLLAIIKMFYKDVYMGIGTSELEAGRLAAASEAFKEVLLLGDMHLTAWIKRGQAFERMDAPLLAVLHYNRVVNVDSDHESGKEALERVKSNLLSAGDAARDKAIIQNAVSACIEGSTFRHILEQIELIFEEANVLAGENFYDYSTTKYQVVLGCVKALRARPELFATNEETVAAVLRELEMSCHLNIASGCLETQRNYTKGLRHCEQVLRLDGNHAICYFRMGQLYQALHSYEKALASFDTAKSLLSSTLAAQCSEEQQKRMLSTVAKEIDKCEFDRSQYDVGYLRSLAQADKAN